VINCMQQGCFQEILQITLGYEFERAKITLEINRKEAILKALKRSWFGVLVKRRMLSREMDHCKIWG